MREILFTILHGKSPAEPSASTDGGPTIDGVVHPPSRGVAELPPAQSPPPPETKKRKQ